VNYVSHAIASSWAHPLCHLFLA